MGQDKKVRDGKLTFILVRGIGEAFVSRDVPADNGARRSWPARLPASHLSCGAHRSARSRAIRRRPAYAGLPAREASVGVLIMTTG